MALDDRDYMKDRATAQFNEWLGTPAHIRGHVEDLEALSADQRDNFERTNFRSPGQQGNSGAGKTVFIVAVGVVLLAAGYLATLRPGETGDAQLPPPIAAAPSPAPVRTPLPVKKAEPPTYVAAPWVAGDASGRLAVSVSPQTSSVRIMLSKDGVSWETFARTGETASIELVPGDYVVQVLLHETGQQVGALIPVAIRRPGQTVALTVGPGL